MRKPKQECLKKAGWRLGTAKDFLGLTDEETAFIETKLALARSLKERRLARGWTQHGLAKRLGTSQSRIAKMEAVDKSVSIDLLVRSLLAVGATRKDLGRIISRKTELPAA